MIRFLLPRRRENVVRCLLFALASTLTVVIWLNATSFSRGFGLGKWNSASADLDASQRVKKVAPNVNTRQAFFGDLNEIRDGPGEKGVGLVLEGEERSRGDESMKKWFMNVVASDKISLDRSIPDVRSEQCQRLKYDAQLPTVSVIIIF